VRDAGHDDKLLVGIGSFAKKPAKSWNDAMPSHWSRMISVGTVILSRVEHRQVADMSM